MCYKGRNGVKTSWIGVLHFEESSSMPPKNWQKMKKSPVQLALKTHFSDNYRYPKIRFRVPDPSLLFVITKHLDLGVPAAKLYCINPIPANIGGSQRNTIIFFCHGPNWPIFSRTSSYVPKCSVMTVWKLVFLNICIFYIVCMYIIGMLFDKFKCF